MKRISKFTCLLCCLVAIVSLSGCSGKTESSDTSGDTSNTPVGDFNFQAQKPSATTSATTAAAVAGRQDNEIDIDMPDLGTWEAGSGSGTTPDDGRADEIWGSNDSVDNSEDVEPEFKPYISSYVDLATDVSVRIGANGYLSVPQSLVAKAVGLDTWLENTRVAYNLVSDADRGTSAVQDKIYADGNLVYVGDSVLSIAGKGITIDVKNTYGTLSMAQSVNAKSFALGRLTTDSGASYESAYSKLGDKIDEQDEELFYRAVYEIADVADLDNVDAQAVVLFDKQTDSMMLVTVGVNTDLCPESNGSLNIIIGSVRYSTVEPDNLSTIM